MLLQHRYRYFSGLANEVNGVTSWGYGVTPMGHRPGDGGCPTDSSTAGPSPSVLLYVVAPLCRWPVNMLPAVLSRGVLLSLVYKGFMSVCGGLFYVCIMFVGMTPTVPPCPTHCLPCPPVRINLLAYFYRNIKKGDSRSCPPWLSPLSRPMLLLLT